MTEGIFYPVFLLFVLALVRALERPTMARQATVVLALSAAFGVRTQAAVLPAAVVAGAMLYGAAAGSFRTTMRSFWPTWLVYLLAATVVAGLTATGVWNPLGAYDVLLSDSWRHPRGLALWAGSNLTSLSLGLGLLALPAATLGVTAMLRRRSTSSEKAFAAAALGSLSVLLLTVVVLAASPHGQGIVHERNLFYVAPLIFICALGWTTNDYKRSNLATSITIVTIIAIMVAMPRGVITARSVDALSFKLWTQLDKLIRRLVADAHRSHRRDVRRHALEIDGRSRLTVPWRRLASPQRATIGRQCLEHSCPITAGSTAAG